MRLIDAERLLEDMGASCLPIMEKGISCITGDESTIADHINAAPTIDAVPVVHARWRYKVAYVSHAHVTNIIWCSACNNGFHRIEGENFKFCPNCGAKMDGEVNDIGQ